MTIANRWVVTGKLTEDGANTWRRADGTWSREIREAGVHADEASAKAVLPAIVAKEQRQITDPYVIEVFADGTTIDPLTARERIRATGPTTPIRRPDGGVRRN